MRKVKSDYEKADKMLRRYYCYNEMGHWKDPKTNTVKELRSALDQVIEMSFENSTPLQKYERYSAVAAKRKLNKMFGGDK